MGKAMLVVWVAAGSAVCSAEQKTYALAVIDCTTPKTTPELQIMDIVLGSEMVQSGMVGVKVLEYPRCMIASGVISGMRAQKSGSWSAEDLRINSSSRMLLWTGKPCKQSWCECAQCARQLLAAVHPPMQPVISID